MDRDYSDPETVEFALREWGYVTLAQFQEMEHGAPPVLRNRRFQQLLYRAYYDAYTTKRLLYETQLEDEATRKLRQTRDTGRAAAILDRAVPQPVASELRARIFEPAEALFQSIGMQTVSKFAPRSTPMALYFCHAELVLNRTARGPGGFYDDLGDGTRQPHLASGSTNLEYHAQWPKSWWTCAESFYDEPLRMRYMGLDPAVQYGIRATYAGDSPGRTIRLVAGDCMEVHPLMLKSQPVAPVELSLANKK